MHSRHRGLLSGGAAAIQPRPAPQAAPAGGASLGWSTSATALVQSVVTATFSRWEEMTARQLRNEAKEAWREFMALVRAWRMVA